jgi:hypothetical protein
MQFLSTFESGMSQTVREQIIVQVDRLDETQRRQLLDFARRTTAPEGTPGRDLLRFAGAIDRADLEEMSRAIHEACESEKFSA